MKKSYNYIVNDIAMMATMCGVNNENIGEMETLLGSAVCPVGNNIRCIADEQSSLDNFKYLCMVLVDAKKQGVEITPEVVRVLYTKLIKNGSDTNIRIATNDTHITVNSIPKINIPITGKTIIPRMVGQRKMLESLQTKMLSFLVGPAGVGKTFFATAFALEQLLLKKKEKYIITRPVVESGEHLGFLPGDFEQKVHPYMRPIYDVLHALGDESMVDTMQEKKQIEIAPLAYMRGRTLSNAVVLLDEAQNCTPTQMKMFLTRMGEGSICIVNGDIEQSDLDERNGLEHALSLFQNTDEVGIVRLFEEDVQRSKLAKIVIDVYNKNKNDK